MSSPKICQAASRLRLHPTFCGMVLFDLCQQNAALFAARYNQREAARRLGLSQPTVARGLQELIARGLISRSGDHPGYFYRVSPSQMERAWREQEAFEERLQPHPLLRVAGAIRARREWNVFNRGLPTKEVLSRIARRTGPEGWVRISLRELEAETGRSKHSILPILRREAANGRLEIRGPHGSREFRLPSSRVGAGS